VIEVGVAVITLALLASYSWRADFEHYSILTTGSFKRVHRRAATDTDHECADLYCERQVADGERRWATKEIVVAGCPVIRYDTTTAYYCEDHISFEFQQQEQEPTTVTRLAMALGVALIEFIDWFQGADEVLPRGQSTFDDAIDATGSAMSLASVTFLILFIALLLPAVKAFKNELGGEQA